MKNKSSRKTSTNMYVCIYINIFIYEKWNLYITSISISSPDLHGFVTAHSAVRGSAGSAVRSVTTVQALQVLGPNHGWGPWFESLFFFKKTPETNKNPALFCGFWKPLWLRTCSIYENWDATSPGEPMGQVKHRILPETDVLPVSGPADILIYLEPTECLVGGLEHEFYDFPLSWE